MRAIRISRGSIVLVALGAFVIAGLHHATEALAYAVNAEPLQMAVAALLTARDPPAAADTGMRHSSAIDRSCAGCHVASHVAALPGFRGLWDVAMQTSAHACEGPGEPAHCVDRAQCRPR